MLLELARREKIAGIKPDEDLDLFMKVHDLFRCISYVCFDTDVKCHCSVVSSWRAGDKASGGVYHEGIILLMLVILS